MHLYLVQHGEAMPKEIDPDPGLTEKGANDVQRIASFLKALGIRVDAIWQSGKRRASETANILASHLEVEQGIVQHRPGLAPLDPVTPIGHALTSAQQDLMIVGHLPFLSRLVSYLIIGNEEPSLVRFCYGAVVCLSRSSSEAAWMVSWMIIPQHVADTLTTAS